MGYKEYHVLQDARTVVEERTGHLRATLDFNRPPRNPVKTRGCWTMEEYLVFTEVWSVVIFQPIEVQAVRGRPAAVTHVLHLPYMQQMWKLLRRIVILMARPHDGDREATAVEVDMLPQPSIPFIDNSYPPQTAVDIPIQSTSLLPSLVHICVSVTDNSKQNCLN